MPERSARSEDFEDPKVADRSQPREIPSSSDSMQGGKNFNEQRNLKKMAGKDLKFGEEKKGQAEKGTQVPLSQTARKGKTSLG